MSETELSSSSLLLSSSQPDGYGDREIGHFWLTWFSRQLEMYFDLGEVFKTRVGIWKWPYGEK